MTLHNSLFFFRSIQAAKRALGLAEDNSVFLEWVVNRLKQLNSTVEADVLAMFIEGVENPDEVGFSVSGQNKSP